MKLSLEIASKGWLLVILLLLHLNGLGQIRFSKVYNHPNGGAGILEDLVKLDDDRLLVIGNSLNFLNTGLRDAHHLLVEEDGTFVSEVNLDSDSVEINPQAILRSEHTGSIYTSGYQCNYLSTSPGPCDFYFAKLDESGDTLFTSVIERRDTSDYLLNMVETRPSKIMLIGWTYDDTTNADADLLFITVDTLGNELNRVSYGGGGTDYVHSALLINEMGESLLTGYTKSFGGGDNDSWVLKVDSIGNVLWHETYNHLSPNGGDGGSEIALLQDGNYVVAGAYDNSSLTASWGYLMKIDGDGNEIWTKRYENQESQGFWACEVLDDGSILAVGQTSNTNDGSQAGWLLKADSNGDTLWTRTYNNSDNTDLLRNMLVLDNGDIVMVGFGRGENSTTQDGWILRVDSMGCVVENCFLTSVNEELGIKNDELNVFPNPANDVVNFSIQPPVGRSLEVTVRVVDMLGRVSSPPAKERSGEVLLNTSHLPNGIYLITVTDQDGNRYTERLVVQH